MKNKPFTLEIYLISLAFVMAIGVRLYQLGEAPLSDAEAAWALPAYHVANPQSTTVPDTLGPQPAYTFLTGSIFYLLGSSNFLARFWPALSGSFLVLLLLLYRKEIGRYPALILAFGLALDPGLVTVSRQAGGPMMAISSTLWAISFWKVRKPVLTGAVAGIALLSGPGLISGVFALGLALAILRLAHTTLTPKTEAEIPSPSEQPAPHQGFSPQARSVLIATAITVGLVGTCFLRYPLGLSAWGSTLPVYFQGWLKPSGIRSIQLVVALLTYEPLLVIFALTGVVRWLIRSRANQATDLDIEEQARRLALPLLWALISLGIALLYPGRQTADLCWALVPLWILTAIELGEYVPQEKLVLIAPIQAILVLLLSGLFWNTLIASNNTSALVNIPLTGLRTILLLGILILAALTTLLVAVGWTWQASRDGLVWGITLALGFYSFGAMWGASHLRLNQPQELWGAPPGAGQVDLLMGTLSDLSEWNTGMPGYIKIVSAVDAPSLRWALRDSYNIEFVSNLPTNQLSAEATPDILITLPEDETPQLSSSYRGQDFTWWVRPAWNGVLPEDFKAWLAFRDAPLQMDKIILWARVDLFPGGVLTSPPQP